MVLSAPRPNALPTVRMRPAIVSLTVCWTLALIVMVPVPELMARVMPVPLESVSAPTSAFNEATPDEPPPVTLTQVSPRATAQSFTAQDVTPSRAVVPAVVTLKTFPLAGTVIVCAAPSFQSSCINPPARNVSVWTKVVSGSV
ncbi:hypothetical protein D3C87_1303430 [compost metagenome]